VHVLLSPTRSAPRRTARSTSPTSSLSPPKPSGTGYTAGGVTLTSVTWTVSGHVYSLKATIPSWTTTGGTLSAAYAVFYDEHTRRRTSRSSATGTSTSGGTQTSSNGTFSLTQNAAGILTVTGS
jgi:hypothetical protein